MPKDQEVLKSVCLIPLRDMVVVIPDEPERLTAGGIHLPDDALDRIQTGTVVRTGPGTRVEGQKETHKIPLRDGDRILFNQFGVTDGKTYLGFILLHESDILAIIK